MAVCCVNYVDSDSGALLAAAVTLPLGLLIALLQPGGHRLHLKDAEQVTATTVMGVFATVVGVAIMIVYGGMH